MYTLEFDEDLNKITHYQQFPIMKPFIGRKYGKSTLPKILLIAESHYLPENSKVSIDCNKWYEMTENDLNDEERDYINTRAVASSNWSNPGHMIFREIESNLRTIFEKDGDRIFNQTSFMNGFQRPSPYTGDSIKYFCSSIDIDKSSSTISDVIKVINPNHVIFISKFAWDNLGVRIKNDFENVNFYYVCHPASGGRYWSKEGYPHGVKKFREILDNIKKNITSAEDINCS